MTRKRASMLTRFRRYVIPSDPWRCWPWIGTRDRDGYGHLDRPGRGTGNVLAHRYSYESFIGPIPDGLDLDHLCRTPSCVNPWHLEPVTRAENTRRGTAIAVRVQRKHDRTHCKYGHEFTEENTYLRSNGTKSCRVCTRDRFRARRAAA